jgi:ABC-type multidrug transport system fused ATPase/permease subunit
VEHGSHEELLKLSGRYAHMIAIQFGGVPRSAAG